MQITLEFLELTQKTFELPKEFEFVLTTPDDEWTDEQWKIYDTDFVAWKREVTNRGYYDEINIVS